MFRSGAVLRLSQLSPFESHDDGQEILEVDGRVVREVLPPATAGGWVFGLGIMVLALLALMVPGLSYLSRHPASHTVSFPVAPVAAVTATAPPAPTVLGLDLRESRP